MGTSWIDRLITWATTRRVPWWVLVAAYAAFHAFAIHVVRWIDGSLETWTFTRHGFDPFYAVAPLVAYGYVSRTANRALDRFRPAIDVHDDGVDEIRRSITTMTPRAALLSLVVGFGFGAFAGLTDPTLNDLIQSSALTGVVNVTMSWLITVGCVTTFSTYGITTLLRIRRLHKRADRVDIFRPDPAHAFASVTARIGAVLIVLVTYSAATDPTTFDSPGWIIFSITAGVLGLASFVVPLLEMRRKLKQQKAELLDQSVVRIGEATDAIEQAFSEDRLDDISKLKTTLDVFNGEQDRVKKASVWPWEWGTVRGFASTLLLPIFMWLVTSSLGKWLDL